MTGDWLLAIHLLGAVLWVGGMFFALFVLRPALSMLAPDEAMTLHRAVFRRFFLVIWHAMPIVLISGYALLFGVYGGFAAVGWNVHVMHLLGLIMGAVFVVIFFGPWAALRRGENKAANSIRRLVLMNLILGVVTVIVAALN